MLKYILCYGDSNTRGANPDGGERYEYGERWPGVLANTLGKGYHIYENGLGGRTTVFDDPIELGRCGMPVLPGVLKVSAPLDLIIVMLGTNDCKERFGVQVWDIGFGMEALLSIMQNAEFGRDGKIPQVLVVSPAHVIHKPDTRFGRMFGEEASEKSAALSPVLAEVAKSKNAHFFDAMSCGAKVGADGLHLDTHAHTVLGMALAEKVKEILYSCE